MKIIVALVMLMLLAGCSAVDGHYASMPTHMPDGQGTYRFEHTYPISINSDHIRGTADIVEYSGQWVANHPKGQGQIVGISGDVLQAGISCKGEFGVVPPDISLGQITLADFLRDGGEKGESWAKGEIYRDKGTRLVFSGYFTNRLDMGWACNPAGEGTRILNDWKVTGTFQSFNSMKSGKCRIEKNSGEVYIGNCSPPPGTKLNQNGLFNWAQNRTSAVEFSLAEGPGVFIDYAGTRYEGYIKRGAVLDGVYTVTRQQKASILARLSNGRITAEHPTPEVIAKQGKECGASNWHLLKGDCVGNNWSGSVDAYSTDGWQHISGDFKNGALVGNAIFTSINTDRTIIGKLEMPIVDDISFAHGVIKIANAVAYDGEMKGLNPNGKGMCRFEGALEACEFAEGDRVDALYKTRMENRKLLAAMERQKQELEQSQNEERRRQAAQAAQQEQEDSEPSTASQLAQFGSLFAQNYQANRAASFAENTARTQARNQQANAMAAEAANNTRLLNAARDSRQPNAGQRQSVSPSNPLPTYAGTDSTTLVAQRPIQVAPRAAVDDSWKTCGSNKKCLVGDGYSSFCSGPADPSKPMCKSECQMDSLVIYHDTTLAPGAYIPGDYKCPARTCNVINSCD